MANTKNTNKNSGAAKAAPSKEFRVKFIKNWHDFEEKKSYVVGQFETVNEDKYKKLKKFNLIQG